MEALKETLKKLICETLSLQDVTPEEIENDAPLFGEGLGLDSVDALELAMELEKQFGVKITSDDEGRAALGCIDALAAFIDERGTSAKPSPSSSTEISSTEV